MKTVVALTRWCASLVIGLVCGTICAAVAITLSVLIAPSGRLMMPIGRWWSRWVLFWGGVAVAIEGREHISGTAAQIFMASHSSNLDIPCIAQALPDHLRFLAKKSLRYIPFFGWSMLASGGCIFIDRGDHAAALATLQKAGQRIRSGHSLLVFPEGTRSSTGRLGAFKKGAFHLAVQAGVPVVPVAVIGSIDCMPKGSLGIRPGQVRVRFGAPIAVAPEATAASLAAQVRAAMIELLPVELQPDPATLSAT